MVELSSFIGWIAVMLLLSSFVKFATVLSILRLGLGLQGGGFGVVILTISCALSLLVLEPQLASVGGARALFNAPDPSRQAVIEREIRPFLERNTDPDIFRRFRALAARQEARSVVPDKADFSPSAPVAPAALSDQPMSAAPISVVSAAFLVTELSEAFTIGVALLIPFLIIDLLAANVFVLLNLTQLPVSAVTIPIKLLLFVVVNGWAHLTEKLVAGYF
jgi:flagellar biosynthesis protein FliP